MGYTYAFDFQARGMKTDKHLRKHLKDYQPPDFGISETSLQFHLDAAGTRVVSQLQVQRLTPRERRFGLGSHSRSRSRLNWCSTVSN